MVRFLEISLDPAFGEGKRLVPMTLARIKSDRVRIHSIFGKHFADLFAADVVNVGFGIDATGRLTFGDRFEVNTINVGLGDGATGTLSSLTTVVIA